MARLSFACGGLDMAVTYANGRRMNLEEMPKNHNRVAYAIPFPARRENPSDLAVTPVPLLAN